MDFVYIIIFPCRWYHYRGWFIFAKRDGDWTITHQYVYYTCVMTLRTHETTPNQIVLTIHFNEVMLHALFVYLLQQYIIVDCWICYYYGNVQVVYCTHRMAWRKHQTICDIAYKSAMHQWLFSKFWFQFFSILAQGISLLRVSTTKFIKHVPTSSKDGLDSDEGCVDLFGKLSHSLVRVLIGVGVYVGLERPRLGEQRQGDCREQQVV